MTSSAPRKVVILGRDAAAWLSANALIRAFGLTGLKVEVVELPSLLSPHDLYASLPPLEAFHRLLGLDEFELMKAASGTYSLGQSFANFAGTRPPFFHPYGNHGVVINRLPFIHYWVKARQAGLKVDFEDFSLNAAAAKQGRFFVTSDATASFSKSDYAYHLRAVPYVQALKAQAIRQGVSVHAARHVDVRLDADSGNILALVTGDGREIAGDLFIDASGAESQLLGGALKVAEQDWGQWFLANRALTASADRLRSLPVYAQVRAQNTGTLTLAPLQDITSVQFVFHDSVMKDEEALNAAAVVSGLRLRAGAIANPLRPGRRVQAWHRNCIAIGEAACVFDPIDNVGLQAIQQGLAHLINLFPLDGEAVCERADYNRITQSAFERLRDFQISHYKLNQIINQPFWEACRDMAVPETLAHKIELFRARGRIASYDDETFEDDNWMAVFIGHGLMPDSYDPAVDLMPDAEAIQHFQQMLGFIREQVQGMSSHDAYLELYATKDFV